MPLINPAKLTEQYTTTFFLPSSITQPTVVGISNILLTDGTGGTYFTNPLSIIPANLVVSTVTAANWMSTPFVYANTVSSVYANISTMSVHTLVVWGSNTLLSQGRSDFTASTFFSTIFSSGPVNISTASTEPGLIANFISSGNISTNTIQTRSVWINESLYNTGIPYPLTVRGETLYFSNTPVGGAGTTGVYAADLYSTVRGLSDSGYISSTQLASTLEGLGSYGYVSSTQLASTVADLATAGYVSSTQLFSTVEGLSIGNSAQYTMYFTFSNATQISSVYLPKGMMRNPVLSNGGVFNQDYHPDLILSSSFQLWLADTTYPMATAMTATGYVAAGQWVPTPITSYSATKLRFEVQTDNTVFIKGFGLQNLNGGNFAVVPPSGVLKDCLATLSLNFLKNN